MTFNFLRPINYVFAHLKREERDVELGIFPKKMVKTTRPLRMIILENKRIIVEEEEHNPLKLSYDPLYPNLTKIMKEAEQHYRLRTSAFEE